MAAASSITEAKVPDQAELLVRLISQMAIRVKCPFELIKLLNKSTVIAGGFILCALDKYNVDTLRVDIDIFTTDPTPILELLEENGYGRPAGEEIIAAVEKIITKNYGFDDGIRNVSKFEPPTLLKYFNIDLITVDKKYEGKIGDFINTSFDLDFCKVYYDGSAVVGYSGSKTLAFNPVKFITRRYPDRPIKQANELFKILKRVEKYQKRGYDITLEFA